MNEVEELATELAEERTLHQQTIAERDRLREKLGRLEWAGTYCERDREMAACPVCDVLADSEVIGQQPHAPDCWLDKELHP